MIFTLYVEEAVADHPRSAAIRAHLPHANEVRCQRYGEIFNPRAQSFRLQKHRPALILAEKRDGWLRAAPADYTVGAAHNYLFAPQLNCLFDCRYCFLRGQHNSAHYLTFVNYEAFAAAIRERAADHAGEPVFFFHGIDGDSLALDGITGQAEFFLDAVAEVENAWLELRTKSNRIEPLLDRPPLPRVVVAFTFTPEPAASALERRVPPNSARLRAARDLAERGWLIGLRFDPLIDFAGAAEAYAALFGEIFAALAPEQVHSVTLGPLRFPKAVFARMTKLYPDDPFLAGPLVADGELVSYPEATRERRVSACREALGRWLPESKIFRCGPTSGDAAR